MTQHDIIGLLRTQKPILEKEYGVKSIGVFGSYSTGKANDTSDVDILVELVAPRYELLSRLWSFLERMLNRKVDLVRKGPHLSASFINTIEKNIVYV